MKAVIYKKYGAADVLQMAELPKPSPKDDEVLIRVHATSVTTGDWRVRSLELPRGFGIFGRPAFGFFAPRQPILGTELSGRIEAVGKNVTKFKVGDDVFAFCGAKLGCYVEYKCMREDGLLAPMPKNLTHQQAVALSFGGTTALDMFRRGKLKAGERVLINGASGGVGTACVQLAKHLGANVTGVCSTVNLELVKSIGADEVIDYTKQDFAQAGVKYDVIVDTVGNAPFSRSRAALKDDGRLLLVLGTLGDLFGAPWVNLTNTQRVIAGPTSERVEDLQTLAKLAEAGAYTPVIDSVYPFEDIVEAHRRVDTGRKRGNVVVTLTV